MPKKMCKFNNSVSIVFSLCLSFMLASASASSSEPHLGSARVVFQTEYGDIEFGFYPDVAPVTVDHIFKLVRLGNSSNPNLELQYSILHFRDCFEVRLEPKCYSALKLVGDGLIDRVDKGFVAQVADVVGGRSAPMNEEQRKEAEKKVIGEFSQVKHVRGILSMGRYEDPNSAQSSFSILLGDAPHLDGQYAIFGKVTKGDETLKKLEQLPTRREGIFVMPTKHITILSSYYYDAEMESCEVERSILKRRLAASAVEIERQRMKCFP